MNVVIQDLDERHFVGREGRWVMTRAAARVFTDCMQAINFCIHGNMRMVRLVATRDADGEELYFYPFGHDPLAKAERKCQRRALRESRRLKRERGLLQGRIEMLVAHGKETRRQISQTLRG